MLIELPLSMPPRCFMFRKKSGRRCHLSARDSGSL